MGSWTSKSPIDEPNTEENAVRVEDLTPPSRSRRSRLPAYSKVTKNRTNSKKNTELPKTGSLDIYNNFQWIVEKGKEEEELSLSSTKGEHAVLDLALVMDCTASMGPWIHHSKNTLSEVIDNIKSSASTSKEKKVVRVAFVGFRDFVDGDDIFSVHDFTSDIGAIKHFISDQQASGGGDVPEDVVGAMHQVLQLSWCPGSVRLVTIIADAPTHGRNYHSRDMSDDYPDGSPAGLVLEDMARKFRDEKLDLTLYKLTNQTEIMYNIIKDIGKDSVDFVDIREEIQESHDSGFDSYSESVRCAYVEKSTSVLKSRAKKGGFF